MSAIPRNLLNDPLCRETDLGGSIPDSLDACSTALPLWEHAIGYEEQDPAILDRLKAGYPRFRFHPVVAELMAEANRRFGSAQTEAFVFPSRATADECVAYVSAKTDIQAVVRPMEGDIHAVIAPPGGAKACRAYWQHSGRVVSSRRARSTLSGSMPDDAAGDAARTELRARVGALYGAPADHVWLFPSGMAAIYRASQIAALHKPAGRRITVDFPYLDTLKVQQELVGDTDLVVPCEPDMDDWASCYRDMENGPAVSAILTEVPSNPLLRTADIPRLSALARADGGVLIIDDTIATPINVDITPWADLITVSLTKFFSGEGDVLAGALIVNPAGPQAANLRTLVAETREDLLWTEDAVALELRSRDFEQRVRRINKTSRAVASYLAAHPAVETLYYPSFSSAGYEAIRRPDGGYGGVMTILLRDAARTSPPFYDALRINKGPSLGTNYSLCCPYTILAHYTELDWAESLGVSRWLIRLSVGLEEADDLCGRFGEALEVAV